MRVSEPVLPELYEASQKLLRAIGWHGVAMVEFKHDPISGQFRLIEINGRFWGSLPLAVAAGADFPAMLYELMTLGTVRAKPEARAGTVGRLLSRDLTWIEQVLRQSGPKDLGPLPTRGQAVRDSLGMLSLRHSFDVQSWRDPWPGLVDLGRIGKHYWHRVAGALHERWRLRRAWQAARAAQAALQRSGGAQQVLFVCYGNINRSAVAHVHSLAHHGAHWHIHSAGFHIHDQRPADPTMTFVASAKGLDLSEWRSHTLTAQDVERADLILAMELAHLDRLESLHPSARGKSYLLAAPTAARANEAEVPDPYGRARPSYELACGRVIEAVDQWLAPAAGRHQADAAN